MSQLVPGTIFGKDFRIVRPLREGGMGAVYKVQHTRMGKVMALKLLRPELGSQRTAVERQTGGKNGGGAMLTPFGQSLVARYRKIERSAESAARKELQALRADIGVGRKS